MRISMKKLFGISALQAMTLAFTACGGNEPTDPGGKGNINVNVSEEGEDGIMIAVEGGETYHYAPMEMPEATIMVCINTEGMGNIAYTEGRETTEIDEEYPCQSTQINLPEPVEYTILAPGRIKIRQVNEGRRGLLY